MEKYNKTLSRIYKHLLQQTVQQKVQQKIQQKVHSYVALLMKQFMFTKLVESLYQ